MSKRNTVLTTIVLLTTLLVGWLIIPEPISPNVVRLTWVTHPQTVYINVRDLTFNSVALAQIATGGITNTVTISGTEGMQFQIQEYHLVNGRLEMILFTNTAPVPHVDFPTATATSTIEQTETPLPSDTPTPTVTPTPIIGLQRFNVPIVMH